MKKAVFSFLAVLAVIFCIPAAAYATFDKTADDAVAWVMGHEEGVGYEYDGAVDTYIDGELWIMTNQCVDLIRGYMDYISGTHTRGNAGTYTYNDLPEGYDRIQKYDGFVPAKGDILIWSGEPGHVAICTAVNSQWEIVYSDQNGDGSYKKVKHGRTMNPQENDYWGVIRPEFKPTYANLGDDFYAVILHDDSWMPISQVESNSKIYLKTEDGSARQIWRFQRQSTGNYEGAYVISSCHDGKILEMNNGIRERCEQLSAQGDFWGGAYQQWYLIPYDDGYIFKSCHYQDEDWVMDLYADKAEDGNYIQINNRNNSPAQVWAVYRGDDVQLKGPILTVLPGNSLTPTTFTWNRVYGADYYNLKVFKDKLYEGQEFHLVGAESGCEEILPAGKYFAYVDAVNYHKYKDSDKIVEFTVPKAYLVQYDANGGTDAPLSQNKIHDTALTLSSDEPKREASTGRYTVRFKTIEEDGTTIFYNPVSVPWTTSYTFKNWNTDKYGTGTSYAPGATYTANASATLYAQWNSTKTTGSVPFPDSPTRPGYVFMGWATRYGASRGNFGSYTPTRDGDVTLYATWKKMDIVLPEALNEIESEAFDGCAFSSVMLSEKTATISGRAFVDCPNLKYIYIPAATTAIAADAFAGVDGLTILGAHGSYAETYATAHGYTFISVS